MSNNYIYNGITTPQWNQIDYIHFGSASSLDAENDNILLGRHVLVKYTHTVFTQDQKYQLMNGVGEANNFADAELWKECYNQDGGENNPDYDGVVFQKVFKENTMQYIPIAQLSTNISPQVFASDYLTIENANTTYVAKEDDDFKDIKALVMSFFSRGEEDEKDETLNRLIEIQAFLGDAENKGTETLISQVSTNATNIGAIQDQIAGLRQNIIIPIESVSGFEDYKNPNTEWPDPTDSRLFSLQMYSKKQKETIDTQWYPWDTVNKFWTKDIDSLNTEDLNDGSNIYVQYYSFNEEDGSKTDYEFYTGALSETYPIAYYKLTEVFVDEEDDSSYCWFGLLYFKKKDEETSLSLHFTCIKVQYDSGNTISVQYLDDYLTEDDYLKQYSDFSSPVSIEEIIKECLPDNNITIQVELLINYKENYSYVKSNFYKTIDIETREIRYITIDSNETKAWSIPMGRTTTLPQWLTF